MEKPKDVSKVDIEEIINESATAKLQQDDKYKLFMDWLIKNGTKLSPSVRCPAAFGTTGYMGLGATTDIPPLTGIIALPHKILITTKKIRADPTLAPILQKYNILFNGNSDIEYNTVVLFLIYERLKGKSSFWFPYFEAVEHNNCTFLDWTEAELRELDSPNDVELEAQEFGRECDEMFELFDRMIKENPNVFPGFDRKVFDWATIFAMTRSFGWGLPCNMLAPMADFLNHHNDGGTNWLVHLNYEATGDVDGTYTKKKNQADFTVLNDPVVKPNLKKLRKTKLGVLDEYVQKNLNYVPKEQHEGLEERMKIMTANEKKKVIFDLNCTRLRQIKTRQLWELNWFESSDSESNDSQLADEDEDDEDEQEDQIEEEKQAKRRGSKKASERADGEPKGPIGSDIKTMNLFNNQQPSKENTKEEEDYEGDDDLYDDDESGEDDEEEDDARSKAEDFTWYKPEDDNIYFVISTSLNQIVKSGQQIYYFYGARSNRYLLASYGFCYKNNKYDSVPFRIWMRYGTYDDKMIWTGFIASKEWEKKEVYHPGEKIKVPLNEFTVEYKLKSSRLNEDVLAYIRGTNLRKYPKEVTLKDRKFIKLPTDLDFELFIMEQFMKILRVLESRQPHKLEEDEKLLAAGLPNARLHFAVVFRSERLRIIKENIKMVQNIIHIINLAKKGINFKLACFSPNPEVEAQSTGETIVRNRLKIAKYLKNLESVLIPL